MKLGDIERALDGLSLARKIVARSRDEASRVSIALHLTVGGDRSDRLNDHLTAVVRERLPELIEEAERRINDRTRELKRSALDAAVALQQD